MEDMAGLVRKKAEGMQAQLVAWRRYMHQYPELSFSETNTSRFVADQLQALPNMHVTAGAGYETAVRGKVTSGSGPTIAIRADMDALPIQEENQVAYASQHAGVMHACGHDGHTAIGLGCATVITALFQQGLIAGTIIFLFQPAEERADEAGLTGAEHMINGGALKNVDAAIALHMNPANPFGEVLIHDGYSMGNGDVFTASIHGNGAHGAYPHQASDPFWMLPNVLNGIYSIPGRLISPLESAVISIGGIQGGTQSNVIPSDVTLSGTIRTYEPNVQKKVHDALEQIFSIVERMGGTYDLRIRTEDPALENHAVMNGYIRQAFDALYPHFRQLDAPFGLAGEDFANIAEIVPSAMFFLGCNTSYLDNGMLHTSSFDMDERVLSVGVSVLSLATVTYLKSGGNRYLHV